MKTCSIVCGTTATICLALGVAQAQQTPPTAPARPQSPATSPAPRTGSTSAAQTTMTGCLYRERDVPGRTPNVVEKAGVLEDYILADARMGAASTPQGAGSARTAGTMYKVESLPDEQLRTFVGKRVEIMGRVDDTVGEESRTGVPTRDRNPISPDAINIADFEATSIREVAGSTCPAKPAAVPVAPR